MSHTTKLTGIKIVDIEALKDAIAHLKNEGVNISLKENTKPRMYYRSQEYVVDYVISIPDSAYDIGLEKQADGSYAPIYDAFNGEVRNQVGAPYHVVGETVEEQKTLDMSKIVDLYGVYAAKNQLESEGYIYGSSVTYNSSDNSYTLEVRQGF